MQLKILLTLIIIMSSIIKAKGSTNWKFWKYRNL